MLQTRTNDTVIVFDIKCKIHNVTVSSRPQLPSACYPQGEVVVVSGEHIHLQWLLYIAANPENKYLNIYPSHHSFFNYFISDAFPQLVKLLKAFRPGMFRLMLYFMSD